MKYLCGIVLAAMVAICCGELCTPDQWEGFEYANGGYVHFRHPGYMVEFGELSYDATNQRTAKTVHYINDGKKFKFNIVVRFENATHGNYYVVDEGKKKCWVKKMPHVFKKICIPADAKKVDEYSLGLKNGGLAVTGYKVEGKKASAYVAVATAGKNIIPVTEQVRGHFGRTAFQEQLQYADIVPGIKDASVFDIPALCKEKMEEADITEYMLREDFILAF